MKERYPTLLEWAKVIGVFSAVVLYFLPMLPVAVYNSCRRLVGGKP